MRNEKDVRPSYAGKGNIGTGDLAKQLSGYRLATAEILYHMPDHHDILQTFIWQDYDLVPDYPMLTKFLDFWTRELDGPLHSVRVAGREIISPAAVSNSAYFQLQ